MSRSKCRTLVMNLLLLVCAGHVFAQQAPVGKEWTFPITFERISIPATNNLKFGTRPGATPGFDAGIDLPAPPPPPNPNVFFVQFLSGGFAFLEDYRSTQSASEIWSADIRGQQGSSIRISWDPSAFPIADLPGTLIIKDVLNNSANMLTQTEFVVPFFSSTVTIEYVSPQVNPPVADFTGSPLSGNTPLTVTFTHNVSNSVVIDNFEWSFPGGNPANATGPGPHQVLYTSVGSFDVSLTASNNAGSDTETKTNYISVSPPTPAGITVTPTSGLTTTEAGGTATFNISANTAPTAAVTVPLSSSDVSEGTVPASVILPANSTAPVTVTVTGVDDAIADGNIAYTIVTGDPTSTDAAYNALTAADVADVSVTNQDNDVAGITVTPTSGLTTTEAGGTATFNISANTAPTAAVTVPLGSSDVSEGTVPASVILPANSTAPVTVTVTGVDDAIADGNIAYTIVTGDPTSTDAAYNALTAADVADVSVTNQDNDVAGITVTPTSGLTTTEAGGTATFNISANTAPTAAVTVPLGSSDVSEGTVPASVILPANSTAPVTVTVTGVDDAIVDGNINYTIVTGDPTSADAAYNGLTAADVADVSVTNQDNDVAGITVTPTSGLTTTEAGGTATFNISANTAPTAAVTVPLSSSDVSEGTVPASVILPANSTAPVTVTVTGVDDAIVDGNINYTIVTGDPTSADAAYNGLTAADVADVSVTNQDNDVAGITVTPTSGLTTTEAGGTATFNISANTAPTAAVTVPLGSSDVSEGTVPASVILPANSTAPVTVTVTGVDDAIVDGNINYTIVTGDPTSADAAYNGLTAADVADVSVTNQDNDVVGITVTPTSGLTTTEAGGTATFNISANTAPTAAVTVPLGSSDVSEGTVPASVILPANSTAPVTVTVTGVDDAIADGNIAYTIVTGDPTSADAAYNTLTAADVADVSVTNQDNDVAGITVTPTSGLTTTEAGGTATFNISANTAPTAAVTVPLSSSDVSEGTVPASVILPANSTAPVTVTVTGVDDAIADGNIAYTIVTGDPTSADAAYNGLTAADVADVSVTNQDNDVVGITVTPTSGLTTTEAGGTATFNISANTAPTAAVTVPLSSSDVSEGTVPASVILPANSTAPVTVTVAGVDDAIVDGNINYTIVTGDPTSADAAYNGLTAADVADVSVTNQDNDVAGITVTPTSGLTTTEAGGTATFNISANTAPTAAVTVPLSSSDVSEGTVPASVILPANSTAPVTVTVTGVDDAIADGNIAYTIVTGDPTSADAAYNTLTAADVADVSVTNQDNEQLICDLSVDPPSHNFSNVFTGQQAEKTFVLRNAANASINCAGTAELDGDAEFSIVSGAAFSIPPGGTHELVVRFKCSLESEGGTAILRLSSNDPDGPIDVPLTGDCVLPTLGVTPESWDFGDMAVGSTSDEKVFVVSNQGTGDLQITNEYLSGPDDADFKITQTISTVTLAAGQSVELKVVFQPQTTGLKEAHLHITSTDPYNPNIDVLLNGNGSPGGGGGGETRTITFGESGNEDFSGVTADAHIREISFAQNRNYGATDNIRIKGADALAGQWKGLLSFDFIPGLQASGVSHADNIVSAKIRLRLSLTEGSEVDTLSLYPLAKNWDEGNGDNNAAVAGEVTWNSARHNQEAWTVPGAGSDLLSSATKHTVGNDVGAWYAFDVTDAIKIMFDSSSSAGWLLALEPEAGMRYFASSEHADASSRPVLEIEVSGSEGTAKQTSAEPQIASLPQNMALSQAYPNPFNPTATIAFDIPQGWSEPVRLQIYDLQGQLVRTLVDGAVAPGRHQVDWDGRNAAGQRVSSGMYIYRMSSGSFAAVKRMTLLQ